MRQKNQVTFKKSNISGDCGSWAEHLPDTEEKYIT